MTVETTECARAEALFVTCLQPSETPAPERVREAVSVAMREHGSSGCAELVAQEYGEHPDSAVDRMRWARTACGAAFARPLAPTG